jgi:hypothetical protein
LKLSYFRTSDKSENIESILRLIISIEELKNDEDSRSWVVVEIKSDNGCINKGKLSLFIRSVKYEGTISNLSFKYLKISSLKESKEEEESVLYKSWSIESNLVKDSLENFVN